MRTNYIHHVPGRLRVRTSLLKGQDDRAARLQLAVSQLEGVKAAEVNTVTGSLKLHYDPKQTTCVQLLDHLRACGYLSVTDQPVAHAQAYKLAPAASTALNRAAKVAAVCILEKAVQHSVSLLFAAVL